jgi:hypothetical protein
MGSPAQRRGIGRLTRQADGRALLGRLLDGLPGVDLRIVTDPTLRRQQGGDEEPLAGGE